MSKLIFSLSLSLNFQAHHIPLGKGKDDGEDEYPSGEEQGSSGGEDEAMDVDAGEEEEGAAGAAMDIEQLAFI